MIAWRPRALRFVPLAITAVVALWIWQQARDDGMVRVTGTVVATTELSLTSPMAARISKVHARAGDELAAGDPILSFDVGLAEYAADRIARELATITSEGLKAQLALQGSVADVDTLIDRKTMELRSLTVALTNRQELLKDGLATEEQIQQAVLAVREAELELARLQEARWRLEQPGAGNVDSAEADRRVLTLQALENREQLELGTLRADRASRLLQVHGGEGDFVSEGAVVARVADLKALSVFVVVDDELAARQPWFRVRVVVDGEELAGSIVPGGNTGPGEVTLALDRPSHPGLRPGRRVDVLIEP